MHQFCRVVGDRVSYRIQPDPQFNRLLARRRLSSDACAATDVSGDERLCAAGRAILHLDGAVDGQRESPEVPHRFHQRLRRACTGGPRLALVTVGTCLFMGAIVGRAVAETAQAEPQKNDLDKDTLIDFTS